MGISSIVFAISATIFNQAKRPVDVGPLHKHKPPKWYEYVSYHRAHIIKGSTLR